MAGRAALIRALGIAVAAGVFLALSGAFGSGGAPLPLRLAYWLVTMIVTTLAAVALMVGIGRVAWLAERPLALGVASTLVMTVALTPLVWVLTTQAFPGAVEGERSLPYFLPSVLVISAAMNALNALAARVPAQTHAAPAGAAPARFLDRLPAKLRGAELWAVQAEDHYLRLHTSRGSDLILMRLSDAITELEGIEGARTHRSWWVARAAIDDARRGDGRATLHLKGAIEAPVSRSYAKALRDAGWF